MKKAFLIYTCVFCLVYAYGQPTDKYPKDYFRSPLDIPLFLAGNFGELRPNHFHAGIDIKTESVEGKNIYAAAEGYVSRIKIATNGYGKVIYITHPNGYVTTYAHLQRFSDKIEEYVKKQQYHKEKFEIELFPGKKQLPVEKGEVIALSGNTGGSGGPHLHFEIRDEKTEIAINPLLFGFDIKDDIKPVIKNIAIYPLNDSSYVNGVNKEKYIDLAGSEGKYRITGGPYTVSGEIGFSVEANDYLNGSSNKCGLFSVELLLDSNRIYYHEIEQIAFSESRYINSHVDYKKARETGLRYEKTHIDVGNKLSIYKNVVNRGVISFNDDSIHRLSYILKDSYGNTSVLDFKVLSARRNQYKNDSKEKDNYSAYFKYDEYNSFENENIILSLPAHILYKDLKFVYSSTGITDSTKAGIHHVHNSYVPLHSYMTVSIKAQGVEKQYRDKVLIVSYDESGKMSAEGGRWDGGYRTTKTRSFGTYTIKIDTTPPAIVPVNISKGKNMSKYDSIVFKISDGLSGIKSYRGTIDGNWILMEYDYKTARLVYFFDDNRIGSGKHVFNLVVMDERGNTANYETEFIR